MSNPFASTIIILGLRVGLMVHSHLPAPTRIDLLIKCVQNPTEICIGLCEQYEHPHNSTQAIFNRPLSMSVSGSVKKNTALVSMINKLLVSSHSNVCQLLVTVCSFFKLMLNN